ncbi:MAG: hypothetical protein ACJ8NS_05580 [Chthoniobacterales bacterium]
MQRVLMPLVTFIGAIIASTVMAASDIPLICEENLATEHKRCGISDAQAREAMRFVRRIPGVSHQIITIDALDLPQVVVTTGEPFERGHTVFLRRMGRRWTVEKTVPWTKKDWIILGANRPNQTL